MGTQVQYPPPHLPIDVSQCSACNNSQYLPEKRNVAADPLSRDFHVSNARLVAVLTSIHLPPTASKHRLRVAHHDTSNNPTILVGRWNSDEFLAYTEKQVKEFTRGVSTRMLQNDTFVNTPLASKSQTTTTNTNGRSHHWRANLNVLGRQAGSLQHQLRPRH